MKKTNYENITNVSLIQTDAPNVRDLMITNLIQTCFTLVPG